MPDKTQPPSEFKFRLSNLKPVEPGHNHPHLSRWRRPLISRGVSGLEIAKGISPSLAKRTVAMALDGELADLADPIDATRPSNSSPATIRARWN